MFIFPKNKQMAIATAPNNFYQILCAALIFIQTIIFKIATSQCFEHEIEGVKRLKVINANNLPSKPNISWEIVENSGVGQKLAENQEPAHQVQLQPVHAAHKARMLQTAKKTCQTKEMVLNIYREREIKHMNKTYVCTIFVYICIKTLSQISQMFCFGLITCTAAPHHLPDRVSLTAPTHGPHLVPKLQAAT